MTQKSDAFDISDYSAISANCSYMETVFGSGVKSCM